MGNGGGGGVDKAGESCRGGARVYDWGRPTSIVEETTMGGYV